MLSRVSRRFASSIRSASLLRHSEVGDCLQLRIERDGKEGDVAVPLVWLKDHCRSEDAYNHSTNQRRANMTDPFKGAAICQKSDLSFDGQQLEIRWADGRKSSFHSDLLLQLLLQTQRKPLDQLYHLWDKRSSDKITFLPKSPLDWDSFSRAFARFGVVCVTGVDASEDATREFLSTVAPLHDTFYGDMWTFDGTGADQEIYHEDTAYSNEQIGPHNDGTYFSHSPGIQVFHCLHPAESGGDTLLVDGFAAAERLRNEDEEAFRILTTTPVDHHYIENGKTPLYSIARWRPVIEVNADGQMVQMRFNPYDRAPLRLPLDGSGQLASPKRIVDYYRAYEALSRICHDPAMMIQLRLQPGTVIFIDNLRVMHARTQFTGYRQMCGCYLSRDNLMARARLHLEGEERYLL